MGSPNAGSCVIQFNMDDRVLSITDCQTTMTDITAAHVHAAPVGENGPVVSAFRITDDGTILDLVFKLTSDMHYEGISGNYYINFHSEEYPSGEIRVQIPRFVFGALYPLSGEMMVPPVDTQDTGSCYIAVTDTTFWALDCKSSTPLTAAHIHLGDHDTGGGPVAIGFRIDDNGIPVDMEANLTPDLLRAGSRGELYINFHTSEHPGGNIRNQLHGSLF